MGFFSRSSGKRQHENKNQGSNYYKREGFLSRILKMFGSFSNSDSRHKNHDSDQRHYSDQTHHRKKYKSSRS